MTDTFRYRKGDAKPVVMLPDTTYAIHIGDLVFQDPSTGKARPASSMVDQGSLALNQGALHDLFAGVAVQRGGKLETGEVSFNLHPLPDQIVVATAGEFEFDCASATLVPGDLIGGCENAGGTALVNQKVVKVATVDLAIGRAVPPANALGNARTTVMVRIESSLFGGSQKVVAGSSSGTV
jgi:hypothetical protein